MVAYCCAKPFRSAPLVAHAVSVSSPAAPATSVLIGIFIEHSMMWGGNHVFRHAKIVPRHEQTEVREYV